MSRQKYFVKLAAAKDFRWDELKGAKSLVQAKQLADQKNNLGEIGMLHLPSKMEVISEKNAQGIWEDVN
jgi:hypothetical protein